MWTDDNSVESFTNIVKTARSLLALSLLRQFPLRGAISIGPLPPGLNQQPPETSCFQQSLIGKAVTEAEKKQEWSGCEVTEAAIQFYKNNCSAGDSLVEKKEIVFYPIPRKHGDIGGGYAIDWVNHHQLAIDIQIVADAFAPPKDRDAIRWAHFKSGEWLKVKIKLCNTLTFVEHMQRHS